VGPVTGRPLTEVLADYSEPPGRARPTHTPRRSVRIGEALWHAAQATAAERGETVTDVITRALRDYVTPTS
jgi:hypothetical protein